MIADAIGVLLAMSTGAVVGWYWGYRLGEDHGFHKGWTAAQFRRVRFMAADPDELGAESNTFREIVADLVDDAHAFNERTHR